jgi:hypothetical protein
MNHDNHILHLEYIPGESDSPAVVGSAERIRDALIVEFEKSRYFYRTDLKLKVLKFDVNRNEGVALLWLEGTINESLVSEEFKQIVVRDQEGLMMFLWSAPVWFFFSIWRLFHSGGSAADKDQQAQNEIENQATLHFITSLNRMIGAPESGSESVWKMTRLLALLTFITGFLVAAVLFTMNTFGEPLRPLFRGNAEEAGWPIKIALILLMSAIFAFPGTLACLFGGPLFLSTESLKTEPRAKDVMNYIGVKTIGGLRVACASGVILLLGLALAGYYWIWTGL